MAKKLLMIVNPRAGRRRSNSDLYDAVAVFCQNGYLVNVFNTTKRGDATQMAKDHGEEYDLVVCCGGDGTLNETINGLMQCENPPALGYLPAGSTNDFATSLGLSTNVVEAAKRVATGKEDALDVGTFNGRYFSYVASFGAFTKASYSASQDVKNILGHGAYVLEGIKDLDTLRPYHIEAEADGRIIDGDFLFGAISNSTSIAGLLHLPESLVKKDDGKMELLLVRNPTNPLELNTLITSIIEQNVRNDSMIFLHVSHVVVKSKRTLAWSLDGEFDRGGRESEIICLPKRLRIVH